MNPLTLSARFIPFIHTLTPSLDTPGLFDTGCIISESVGVEVD